MYQHPRLPYQQTTPPQGIANIAADMAHRLSPTDDVGVLDEVQMMQDASRGGAWTRAILGEPASPPPSLSPW